MANQSSINAGVHNITGTDFQKHCALFVLLENYPTIKEKEYYIYLEHHDDFLFCYLSDSKAINIDAYQAKKGSSTWKNNRTLHEIIHGMLVRGLSLADDDLDKADDCEQQLHFVTNSAIRLEVKRTPAPAVTCTIGDTNCQVPFLTLDKEIQNAIRNSISKMLKPGDKHLSQLDNVVLKYIDLPKTILTQKATLVGLFSALFGATVKDHSAAVEILLKLFRGVEGAFNQAGDAKLNDNTKRVSSNQINNAIDVICTQQKAYTFWKDQKQSVATKLNISIFNQDKFELNFENSFDLLKDLKQVEHQKIKNFVQRNRSVWAPMTNEVECIGAILEKFNSEENSQLDDLQKKAAIYAAYFELKG